MKWLNLTLYFLVLTHLSHAMENTSEVYERYRRYLVYPNGGLLKIILGFNVPVELSHKRDLGCAYNLQGQFRVPNGVLWWTSAPLFVGVSRKVQRDDSLGQTIVDESRKIVYNILERFKNGKGKNGRACLLLTICEISQSPLSEHNGIFGELIDTIFIPGTSKVDDYFHDAQMAGLNGVDCRNLYNCPIGDGFLDSFLFS